MKKFSIFALAAIFFAACATDQTVDLRPADAPETIYASFDEPNADSRVYVEQGTHLCWTAGDEISYFPGVTFNMQYRFKGETGATNGSFQKMTFDPVTGIDLQCNYAIYPYAETTEIAADGTIAYHFPSVQHYAENSFGLGANVMVAATKDVDDSVLRFRNAGGYLKLQLYGSDEVVKSITLKGNNNEKIAGAATITMAYGDVPAVAMSDDATSSVSIDCGEGVALSATAENPTSFWFVLPEVTFEKGFAITVTNANGELFEKVTSNEVVITRNEIQPMAAIEVEFASVGPANNEIWYTSSDGKIVTPNTTSAFGVSIKSNVYENGKGVITFDGNVTSIGGWAFYGCSRLTSVTIPNSVTSIGEYAFRYCSGLIAFYGKFASADNHCLIVDGVLECFAPSGGLTAYTIPDGVTEIGYSAFEDCSSLTSVTIPDSVTSIGKSAFSGCSGLTSVHISDLSAWCKIYFDTWASNPLYYAKNLYLNGKLITQLVVTSDITEIKNYAFMGCDSLISVTIPDSVTSIGDSAFQYCRSLTSIIIPNSVTLIKSCAFYDCRSLTSITIPDSVTSIGSCAFYDCRSLTSITIPDSVTTIEELAFSGCSGLTSAHISDLSAWCKIYFGDAQSNPLYYADDLYLNGKLITQLVVTSDITEIKKYAFVGCDSLTSVIIPDSVTSIGESAFNGCKNLASVTIGNSVTSIEKGAFMSCYKLVSIYCKSTTPPAIYYYYYSYSSNSYTESYSIPFNWGMKIYVPRNSYSAYMQYYSYSNDSTVRNNWFKYESYIEPYDFV